MERKLTPRQFAYWLQGYFELSEEPRSLNPAQTQLIKDTLNGVFVHIDATFPEELASALDAAHASSYFTGGILDEPTTRC